MKDPCAICGKPIIASEAELIFTKTRREDLQYFHLCCFQENFLFEVWGALKLGIKYESHCPHVNYTAEFNHMEREKMDKQKNSMNTQEFTWAFETMPEVEAFVRMAKKATFAPDFVIIISGRNPLIIITNSWTIWQMAKAFQFGWTACREKMRND